MELKLRKQIKNGCLPKFTDGLFNPSWYNQDSYSIGDPLENRMNDIIDSNIQRGMIQAKTRNPMNQSVNPNRPTNTPITTDGITDITPQGTSGKDIGKKTSSGINVDAIGGALQSGISFAKTMHDISKTNKSVKGYLADAGTSEQSVGGISYKTIKPIYRNGKLPRYSDGLGDTLKGAGSGAALGASVGSVIPGIGTGIGAVAGGIIGGIGGLFGGKARRKKEQQMKEEANRIRMATNNFNFDSAMSQYLQQKEQEDLSEPHYATGKMPLLDTSFGMVKGEPNARVDKGEWMINTITGAAHKVKRGAGDNALAHVEPEDAILSKKRGAADYFERTGDLQGALSMNKNNYCNGKLPRLAEGWISNAIVHGLGGMIGLGQYLDAKNQDVKRPNTYASNPYENRVLRGLAGLQYNPYPILNQLNNTRARYDYVLNNSGGLSGAQRYLGKVANASNMYKATSDLLTNLQERNIGLRSNYYNTMANLGTQAAQRRMQANQYDLDYYSKAHAARQSGMQMGVYNMLNQMQNWYANDFKRRQFNDTMRLYRDDQKLDWEKLKRMTNGIRV